MSKRKVSFPDLSGELFLFHRKLRPMKQERSAGMRTSRRGIWLLAQPRSGAIIAWEYPVISSGFCLTAGCGTA